MNNVELDNVFFSYGQEKYVLQGVNFNVQPNEIVGLVGANGSGKTTTFKLLSGLLFPDEGSIKVCGISVLTDLRKVLKRCAYLPDQSLLYPSFSALENLNLFSVLWGMERSYAKTRAEKLLKEVNLWNVRNQWVKSYSRGMTQKLSICAALLHEPRILLMDEPFSGLDVQSLIWARDMLKEYVMHENRSIIFTAHSKEVVESLATRTIVLQDGKILQKESFSQPESIHII